MKKTVLIFGISSFVGSNLAQILKDDFRIIGTYFKTPVEIPGITCYPCDVLKKEYVTNLTALFKPDITIYAVGLSSLTACKTFPKQADALNTVGAINCCTASERYGSKFVLLSSGFVLGGEDQVYSEGDTPFPNTALGNSLSSSEFYVQRSCLNYLILRSSPLYGRSFNPKKGNWFEGIQASFAHQEPVQVDDSVFTGFLDVSILGKVLKNAFEANVTNRLFQVSSRDWMSRYEFARLYAKTFKKDDNLLQRMNAPFPLDQRENSKSSSSVVAANSYFYKMDTTNIQDYLGIKMPSVEESIHYTYKRFNERA